MGLKNGPKLYGFQLKITFFREKKKKETSKHKIWFLFTLNPKF